MERFCRFSLPSVVKPKLRDECVTYLPFHFEEIESEIPLFQRIAIPLICRRYFLRFLSKTQRTLIVSSRLSIGIKGVKRNEYFFLGPDFADEPAQIKKQFQAIRLLQLMFATPESESLDGSYNVYLKVADDVFPIHALMVIRELFACKIPVTLGKCSRQFGLHQEFIELLASDFTLLPHFVFGTPRELLPLANPEDPRVFPCVDIVTDHLANIYAPHILKIKTKLLSLHIDNMASYDPLPRMPFLRMLSLDIAPIGVYNRTLAVSHYSQIANKISMAAPRLQQTLLNVDCAICTKELQLAQEGFLRLIWAVEAAVDGMRLHLPLTLVRIVNVQFVMPFEQVSLFMRKMGHGPIDENAVDDAVFQDLFHRLLYENMLGLVEERRRKKLMTEYVDCGVIVLNVFVDNGVENDGYVYRFDSKIMDLANLPFDV